MRIRPSRLEVDLDAIAHNVRTIRGLTGTPYCAVVKADGYGHGAVPVARAALDAGATWLAVALVEEGRELRAAGITAPILLLSEPPVDAVADVLDAGLTATVYQPAFVAALDAAVAARGTTAAVHAKVDTGMARVGAPRAGWEALFAALRAARHLHAEALWTHFARADEPDVPTTDEQLDRFAEAESLAAEAGLAFDLAHTANSAAALLHERARRDLVRVGIATYGLSPAPDLPATRFGLRQAARLVTEVSFVKRVAAGTPASYGHTWSAPTDGWLATLPIGYADGVPRRLSNRAEALHGGVARPLAGNVCMDQVLLWCGEQEPVVGDEVVLLGSQGQATISVDRWAGLLDTISYEVTCALTGRLPRVAVGAPGDA